MDNIKLDKLYAIAKSFQATKRMHMWKYYLSNIVDYTYF